MSWTRKILRVDLAKGTCTSEPLNMEWAGQYLGQRGLASKYLSEEVDPKCDPLGPENNMIMATGAIDGHHGLDLGTLLGDLQGAANRRHRPVRIRVVFSAPN